MNDSINHPLDSAEASRMSTPPCDSKMSKDVDHVKDAKATLYARLILSGLILAAFCGLQAYAAQLGGASLPHPEVADAEVGFNQLTNGEILRQDQANKQHSSYVTDVEFAAMASWVIAPLMIVACLLMKFPDIAAGAQNPLAVGR